MTERASIAARKGCTTCQQLASMWNVAVTALLGLSLNDHVGRYRAIREIPAVAGHLGLPSGLPEGSPLNRAKSPKSTDWSRNPLVFKPSSRCRRGS